MSKKPILFEKSVKVRFSDIDRYQHVNTIYYPDYVFTSRFEFLGERFGLAPDFFEKQGFGFYTVRYETRFTHAIPASASYVQVASFVKKTDRALITVEFKIHSSDGALTHATGEFDFFVVDLATGKPVKAIPASFEEVIFETDPS